MMQAGVTALAVAGNAFGGATDLGPALGSVSLAACALALTFDEIRGSAGGWFFKYHLAPQGRQGTYSGLYSLGSTDRLVVGPLLVAVTTSELGFLG